MEAKKKYEIIDSIVIAADCLEAAYDLLKDGYDEWSVGDAIQLAKIIAQDIHTKKICMKMDEIRYLLDCTG